MGGIKLASIASALQVFKNLLVNITEGVAVLCVVEIDFGYFVDDLANKGARLHVVVGIFKNIANHQGALGLLLVCLFTGAGLNVELCF